MTTGTIKSVHHHLDTLIESIDLLKQAKHTDFIVTSPVPRADIEEAIYDGQPSPVRWFTMFGAIFGGTGGFVTSSMLHLNWPMIIPAGKPLVSIPAFLIITFEATILFGAFFTLLGLLIMCRLPAKKLQIEVQDRRFSDDVFGLIVNSVYNGDASKIRELLLNAGAEEVSGMESNNA